uniref:Protein kinase domain-containing protein n=1 Tax=Quercus lobata TaxID=97700 RepID=A0A7N2RBP2_QUELO
MAFPFWSICIWILTERQWFMVGIWLVGIDDNTVVCIANRDDPLVTSNAMTLDFTENGKLLLTTDEQREEKIISATMSESASYTYIFCPPVVKCSLVLSNTNHSTGQYRLKMQIDGNLVLYPVNTLDIVTEAYWASGTNGYTLKYRLYLSHTGLLQIINSTSMNNVQYLSSSLEGNSTNTIYRATPDVNGFFQLYSHAFDNTGKPNSSVIEWSALEDKDLCKVNGFCGFNSFCTLNDNQPYCVCLPGTNFVDENHPFLGCERLFRSKVGIRSWNETIPSPVKPSVYIFTSKKVIVHIHALILAFATFSCLALGISGLYMFKIRVLRYKRLKENETLGLTKGLALNLFSYDELRRATRGFKDELGKGSFGTVYKGALYKGKKLVAVKRLEKLVEEGEKEFRAEMQAIGRTHHKNLVQLLEGEKEFRAKMQAIGRTHHKNLAQLLGYCAEGSKRLLVYEYMSNGSLADVLFKGIRCPYWDERVRIALDVARGILYLHEECKAPIIHCDIKPSNILMDDFWTAKISDFGLAKLLMLDQTRTFMMVSGTRGYMTPKWQKNTPISMKADVYSYGMVLLEIVCCRRNMDVNASIPEEIVLSTWVYKCFVARELDKIMGGEEVDKRTLENMVKVGLWCIQDEPFLRPSMNSVVLMLEGITNISVPPCPTNIPM